MNRNLSLKEARRVITDIGGECVLIGGWASYLHLRKGSLSHDVDTILSPLQGKERVVDLISAESTHLGKLSGELHGAHVDLYVPYMSKIGGISVDRLIPYSTIIDGIRVLVPEAHLLTKAACVLDDGRYRSIKRDKDIFEIRGLMSLIENPSSSIAIWASTVDSNSNMIEKWETLLDRIKDWLTKRELKGDFGNRLKA